MMKRRPGKPSPHELAARRRDVAALAQRVHGLAAVLLGPGADAEDACQEAILSALANIEKFDPERGRLESWLFAITRRRCADSAASRGREIPLEVEPSAGAPTDVGAAMQRLDVALLELSLPRRTAFALVVMQELGIAEAAAIEGVPPGTIKSRVARAREQLRRSLESAHDPR